MEKVFERRVRCKCGRQLIHKAEVRLWTEEVIDPSHEQSRRRDDAVPVSPISPQEHSSAEEARGWGGDAQDIGAWDPRNVTNPSSSAHDGPRNSLRDVLGEHTLPPKRFVPLFTPKSLQECLVRYRDITHDGPRNSLRDVLGEHTLPPKRFVPLFTPKSLQECLVRYRDINKKKDDLRRCDQCNEWPKQRSPGMPVVLCHECWTHVKDTNYELYRGYVAKNDEFEHAKWYRN